MRIFIDEAGIGWDDAWSITTQSVAYTNHTVLAEALERELEKRESSGGKAAVHRSSDAVTRQRQATRQAVRPR